MRLSSQSLFLLLFVLVARVSLAADQDPPAASPTNAPTGFRFYARDKPDGHKVTTFACTTTVIVEVPAEKKYSDEISTKTQVKCMPTAVFVPATPTATPSGSKGNRVTITQTKTREPTTTQHAPSESPTHEGSSGSSPKDDDGSSGGKDGSHGSNPKPSSDKTNGTDVSAYSESGSGQPSDSIGDPNAGGDDTSNDTGGDDGHSSPGDGSSGGDDGSSGGDDGSSGGDDGSSGGDDGSSGGDDGPSGGDDGPSGGDDGSTGDDVSSGTDGSPGDDVSPDDGSASPGDAPSSDDGSSAEDGGVSPGDDGSTDGSPGSDDDSTKSAPGDGSDGAPTPEESATADPTNTRSETQAVEGSVSNKGLGIGLGVGIGCVAAIGLAGLLVANKRKRSNTQTSSSSSMDDPNVSTHWRPQSFMGVVASVVAKLPRSASLRSNRTQPRESAGMAVGAGQGAIEDPHTVLGRHPSNSSSRSAASQPPSLARVHEHPGERMQEIDLRY